MRPSIAAILGTVCAIVLPGSAYAVSELVIAVRYLQAEGASHSHLYLYREDGKLLRQLTNDNSGQDLSPVFAPNGETIVFSRDTAAGTNEFWSIAPIGKKLKKLAAAPGWYSGATNTSYFTNVDDDNSGVIADPAAPAPSPPVYKSPDGAVELVLKVDPKDEDDQIDGEGHGKHYVLRDLKSGLETEFSKLPGFFGVFELLHDRRNKDQRFLFDGPLRLAFFGLHLNSTDGDTCSALDLSGRRLVRLSPNWATPIPLPGQRAFLTWTTNRYVPIPDSKKTANCSYLERWDEKLNKIRYAREKSAAICYGFSMYRPGLTPTVVTIRKDGN
jgi:hypothetical protein